MSNNHLHGTVPDELSYSGAAAVDFNCFPISVSPHHNPACALTAPERAALVDIFDGDDGAEWGPQVWPVDSSGLVGDPCFDNWPGVQCVLDAPSHVM